MPAALDPLSVSTVLDRLTEANRRHSARYPGEPTGRQPIHTVYGGAQLFQADTAVRLGVHARHAMETWMATPEDLVAALGIDPALAPRVWARTRDKLHQEPVEDLRIDFEDGFGIRPDEEEDHHAERAARQVAAGLAAGTLPPFCGIRVKVMNEELKRRAVRTVDRFVTTLLEATEGKLPPGFVVTLPKVTIPEQVEAFVDVLEQLEAAHGLPYGTLKLEIMIEVTQAILDQEGRSPLPSLLAASRGRCTGAHFGTYDYTASANITAAHQRMDHPACDFAKEMMRVAYAGTGIFLSDGATNVMPVPVHRGASMTATQAQENRAAVHRAWRLSSGHIRHSLEGGFFQGWDLHPAQLPVRYATVYAFFLEGAEAAGQRLSNFVNKAAQATLVGDVFDDAATGQGLLNYFLRALNCGAVTVDEATATGLTVEEIQGRSFLRILEARRRSA